MLPVAVCLAAGIAAGRFVPAPLGVWALIGAACLVGAIWTHLRPEKSALTSMALGAAILCAGAAHVKLTAEALSADHVLRMTGPGRQLATVRGTVVSAPQIVADDPSLLIGYRREPRTQFLLEVDALRSADGWKRAAGLARVVLEEPHPGIQAGQTVEVECWLGRFSTPANPGQFDARAHAELTGVRVWLRAPGRDSVGIRDRRPGTWLSRWWWRLRGAARYHVGSLGDPDETRLLEAMLVGERHPALQELNDTMKRAGIAHFLSISGMHVAVFLGFVYGLCRLVGLSMRRGAGVVLAVLVLYVLAAEPRPPLLRAAIMAASVCVAALLGRRHSTLNALCVAAVVLLAIDPMQLFSAGFQLSFAIVLGLILLHGPMRRQLFGWWFLRRRLRVIGPDDRWGRWWAYRAAPGAMTAATASLNAWIVATPLVAYHFGLFCPYAAVLSLLLMPLVVAILVPGYLSMGLAPWVPNVAAAVGRASVWAGQAMAAVVGLLEHLPALSVPVRPVPVVGVAGCYVTLAAVVFRDRVPRGIWLAAGAAVLLAGGTVWTQLPASPPDSAELHVLAVGAGQCCLLRTTDGQTVLLDAGTRSPLDANQQVLQPFLRDRKLPAPRVAFVSHANLDHYNVLIPLIRDGSVERIYLNDYFGRSAKPGSMEDRFLRSMEDTGVAVVRVRAGDTVRLGPKTTVHVLWPPADLRDDLTVNDTSLVLRVECDGRRALVTGDLDSTGQAALMERPAAISADVLLLPHHGGWETTLPTFVDAVDAEWVVVSASHRRRAPVSSGAAGAEFYERMGIERRVWTTAEAGSIHVTLDRNGVHVRSHRKR